MTEPIEDLRMFPVVIKSSITKSGDPGVQYRAFDRVLCSLRANGQLLGREILPFEQKTAFFANAIIPEKKALAPENNNAWVNRNIGELAQVGLAKPLYRIPANLEHDQTCQCKRPREFVLYADYSYMHSPLRCLRCFGPIPLYRIPVTEYGAYVDILSWSSDFESCHRLYMNDVGVDRFATRQMNSIDAALTKYGLDICRRITESTGKKTYYFLRKHGGRSMARERERRCPSCGGEWLLKKRLHIFDFKCTQCSLLSWIGTGVN